jgi:transglutaminase-like putative cysteine protease
MLIDRRRLLQLGGALTGAALFPRRAPAQERFISGQGPWRKFDLVTQISFRKPKGRAQAWIPVPSVDNETWSNSRGSDWETNAVKARLDKAEDDDVHLVYLEWGEKEGEARIEISSHAESRDRATDFSKPAKAPPLPEALRRRYTAPLSFVPNVEWLKDTVALVIDNAKTDLGKAKALYEWVVEERTCQTSELKALLGVAEDTETPEGCDYLNGLFVALARACGLPAREIYGVRVAASQFGYESLGAMPDDVTAETHSRAEVWLADYGWVPATPGDVRRVIGGEGTGNLALTDPRVVAARVTLFGAWEGNWVAYNMANDFLLPDSTGVSVPFLIRPRIITSAGLLEENAPGGFTYKLATKELPS